MDPSHNFDETGKDWQSYHIYYHSDRERLLRELISPLVNNLSERGWINGFFFVRYALGGPHIRLRLCPDKMRANDVRRLVMSQTSGFLKAHPSLRSESESDIKRLNSRILASDPHEIDEGVRPDNCIVEMPFRPELDRYGGRQLLPLSLRMFWFTSLRALEFALMQPSLGRPRATALSIRYLLRLSLCLSRNPIDRLQLWQTNGGDRHLFREYLKRREVVFDIFRQEEGTIPVEWQRAGDELLMKLSVTESSTRLGILRSQIHMFANRLGLSYAEELAFYFFFQSVQKSSNWEDHIQKGDIP
jgi:hypothetical protein